MSDDDEFDSLLARAARLTPVTAPAPMAPALEVGTSVCQGRFRIERRLGEGAMGVVYAAFDTERRTRVALKTLSRVDPDGIYRLKNEFRALCEVVHPNLVQLHKLYGEAGLWLFAMQLIDGVAFDTWVRPGGRVDVERLRGALPQLVDGVNAIHAAGKLHRDLKPSNVLVSKTGHVSILDFGLATDPDPGGAGETLGAWVAGTPAYMAPEQAAGTATTEASDWYAVGVMVFEALTGELPFGGTAGAIMSNKQVHEAPTARSLAPDVPEDLDALCAELLQRNPARRPDGAALAERLGAPARQAPRTASRPPAPAGLHGREAELSVMRGAFEDSLGGQVCLMQIAGPSGLGKSALAHAMLDELGDASVVLRGRCYEKEALPFNAFDRLVDDLSRHVRRLPYAEAAALMPRDVRALARIFPVLERLEAVAATPLRPVSDEQELRRRAFDAFGELLGRIRDRSPLVVFMDDLQWADEESARLLTHLLMRRDAAPALWLASHRELAGERPHLQRLLAATRRNSRLMLIELELSPLSAEAAASLAGSLLDDAAPEVAERIARESGGNPFLVGELARYVQEGGDAAGVSLEQALGERIERLGEDRRRVLEAIAVCGRPVAGEVIAEAVDTGADAHAHLDALHALQLVRTSENHAHECYHDSIRQAVAGRLPDAAAVALHRRLAEVWEARPNADPEVLFEHSRAAGLASAGMHAATAAARSVENLAFERAAELYEHALSLGVQGADPSMLWERRAEALSLSGRWVQAAECLARARELAQEPERRLYLLHMVSRHYLGSGRTAEGMPYLRELLKTLGLGWPRSAPAALFRALFGLSLLWLRGAPYRVRELDGPRPFDGRGRTEAARYRRDESGRFDESVRVEALLGAAGLVPPYDLWRGLYFVVAFARAALRHGEAERTAVALGMLAGVFLPSRALSARLGDEAVALARERGTDNLGCVALTCVALARLLDGRLREGHDLAAEATQALRHGRAFAYEAWTARSCQGFALIMMGEVARARELFALNASEASELDDELATLGGELSTVLLFDDDVEGAEALLARKRTALERAGDGGILSQMVKVEATLCALYQGRGFEATALAARRGAERLIPVDSSEWTANCALQAITAGYDRAENLARVRRTARRLKARGDAATAGAAAQLTAALCHLEGDDEAAVEHLQRAAEAHEQVDMSLHADVVRYVAGGLRGGEAGEKARREAEASLRRRGIANPAGWVRMLAPGFEDAN